MSHPRSGLPVIIAESDLDTLIGTLPKGLVFIFSGV